MEVPDAYQAYVEARRSRTPEETIATLRLPADELAAIGEIVSLALANEPNLTQSSRRRWETILRLMAESVREAETV